MQETSGNMGCERTGRWLGAAVAMFVLYALLAVVTHIAAPIGAVWKVQPGIDGSNLLGMAGNMMTFLAYLFVGIPAGFLLMRIGYKRTTLAALGLGILGIAIQLVSAETGGGLRLAGVPASFFVYLLGSFICGFTSCFLNIVINPMLNALGGGGNRANQLIMFGGGVNSVVSTLTPIFVMLLVGEVTLQTSLRDVSPLLWWALGILAVAFAAFAVFRMPEPAVARNPDAEKVGLLAPLRFRHTVFGVVGIFLYIGIEIGVPGTLNFWLLDPRGAFEAVTPAVAGSVTGMFFFLMLVGRFAGSWIGGRVSGRAILAFCAAATFLLVAAGVFTLGAVVPFPVFTGRTFIVADVPLGAALLASSGLFVSVLWAAAYNMAMEGLGKYTEAASGLLMTMVCGGGVLPLAQGFLADRCGYVVSYVLPAAGALYLLAYALLFPKLIKNKNPQKEMQR